MLSDELVVFELVRCDVLEYMKEKVFFFSLHKQEKKPLDQIRVERLRLFAFSRRVVGVFMVCAFLFLPSPSLSLSLPLFLYVCSPPLYSFVVCCLCVWKVLRLVHAILLFGLKVEPVCVSVL